MKGWSRDEEGGRAPNSDGWEESTWGEGRERRRGREGDLLIRRTSQGKGVEVLHGEWGMQD